MDEKFRQETLLQIKKHYIILICEMTWNLIAFKKFHVSEVWDSS